jgi:hypothetical protein
MKGVEPCWKRVLFPLKKWNQVAPLTVKAWLQEVFEIWGKPEKIRVDNGQPWGTGSSLPSALALWLVGIGIEVIYGRPAQSRDNAMIERTHGVLDRWVVPCQQADIETLQEQLEWAVHTQRERYRSPHHRTRAEVFPQLYTNLRTYRRQDPEANWEISKVACYLSGYTFKRKVEKQGQITLFANRYSVGSAYARQIVSIDLDVQRLEWVLSDENGKEITRHSSRELDYELICNLRLAKRQNFTKGTVAL